MSATFTPSQLAIIEAKNFAHLATLFGDGSPQVTPVWVDHKDGNLRINSAEGRAKVNNLRRDPRVAIEVNNSDNPYEYVEVRGRVVEITTAGADEHIDALAKKYMDADSYPFRREGEVRVTIVIEPEKIAGNSGGSSASAES